MHASKTGAFCLQLKRWLARLQLLTACLTALPVQAQPEPPPGWTRQDWPQVTIYQPDGERGVQVRLFTPEAGNQHTLADWFQRRLKQPVEGVGSLTFGEVTDARGVLSAVALGKLGGRSLVVAASGCQAPSGARHFGQLLMPADLAKDHERHALAYGAILGPTCLDTATALAAKGRAQPARPASPAATALPVPADPAPLPPGRSLAESNIEGVLYSWQQRYEFNGFRFREWVYLLLKDGTARRELPRAAPADFDLAADRLAQAKEWGRWKRSGKKVLVDFGEGFDDPPGQMFRFPAKAGERLNGIFETASSYSPGVFAGGVTTWQFLGLELRPDGSFKHWRHGGAGGSSGTGSSAVTTMSVYDDKGASTSVGGPSFGGGVSSKTRVGDDDLEGSYHVEGWTLTLRYRNGQVKRSFFYTDDDRSSVWFDNTDLIKRKPK